MRPELWKIPYLDLSLKSYGVMLMLGFLTCIWLAMRRASRVKADPDILLNIGFVCLFCGVGGARIFFVAHYWKTEFAWQPNPLWAAINITSGGLEYYGGLIGAILGAMLYLRYLAKFHAVGDDPKARPKNRTSVRLYLDILAPSAMLGLAFGRAGCFLNGCCWGGVCMLEDHGQHAAALPWAMTFPYGSGAHNRQWENREVALPAELIYDEARNVHSPFLLWWESLNEPAEAIDGPIEGYREISLQYNQAKKDDPDAERTKALRAQVKEAQAQVEAIRAKHHTLLASMQYPSRQDPSRHMNKDEVAVLAAQYHSLPVHPAQLYGLINAVLLSVFLARVFHRRKRHGVVFALMLVLYPITRTILELIRVDNPHDVGGLTISQAVSVGMLVTGLAFLAALYTRLPARSPRALPWAGLPGDSGHS